MAKKQMNSREAGLILGSYLIQSPHLHYGLWEPDATPTLADLPKAQQDYCQFLIDHFPRGVRRVLDVGCGTGGLAKILHEKGYEVQCLSPSETLNALARDWLGPSVPVSDCRWEDFPLGDPTDLVIFSESFQYVQLKQGLEHARQAVARGGHVLICDFFKRDTVAEEGALGGGHRLSEALPMMEEAGFRIVENKDITDRLAPNMILLNELIRERVEPMWNTLGALISGSYPRLSVLAGWLARKKLNKFRQKYFSGVRSSDAFKRHKSYRLLLLKAK